MRLVNELMASLKQLLPNAKAQTIGDAVAHLDSCWDAAQKLDAVLRSIAKPPRGHELEALCECLIEIEVTQLEYVHWWTGQLRRPIAELQRELNRELARQRKANRRGR